MNVVTLLLIALGLAMDSFSVSVASGLTAKNLKIKDALRIGFSFGSFQGVMPIIGWLAGVHVLNLISGFDHWVVFGLLVLIGCRMIYESAGAEPCKKIINPFNLYVLLLLSVATSIDALAVGLSLSFLKIYIMTPAVIIGAVTFSLSFLGVFLGKRSGRFFERKVGILGGLILIGIGTKILIEHLI